MLVKDGIPGDVYNVCSGNDWTIEDVLNYLISLSDSKIEKQIDPDRLRPSDLPVLIGDNSKITKEIKWEPEISIELMLCDLLDYWRNKSG